jgi:hypothetical protein
METNNGKTGDTTMSTYTTVYGRTVELSDNAVNVLAQVGDPAQIVRKDSMRLAEGIDPEQLRRECLDGAEDDHIIAGWNEYVDALAAVGDICFAVPYVYDAFEPGDRVRAGEGDDADEGEVVSVNGLLATVAWSSGVETTQPQSMLRLT